MEGVEIVIKPIHLERVIYSIIIIVLIVLLIIHWRGGSCISDQQKESAQLAEAAINQTNESINASVSTEPSLCSNGIKDQDETDIDCGGSTCEPCAEFKQCNVDSDCETDWCRDNMKCVTPTCSDGVKNQGELNIDCGGPCKSANGEFYYDNACHKEPKPSYSGRVDMSILSVGTSLNSGSGYARIDSVRFTVVNGKPDDFVGDVYIYARTSSGMPYFESSISGDEIPLKVVELPLLSVGQNYTATVNVTNTLTETEGDEAYRVVLDLRDTNGNLIKEATWTNH